MADLQRTGLDVLVIGAGISGIYMLHRLRDHLGLRVTVCEASDGVGGTWHLNRYPGARCDTESFVYCYSFSPELCQEWEWSGKYPTQAEIHRYLNHVVDRFDLARDIRLNTRVTEATYDDGIWRVTTESGERLTTRFLVTAVGLLASAPHLPHLPGLETFEGRWAHTGAWPAEGIEMAGKRVGVIGTGSTGTQSIPPIAEAAEHLTVFQRTAQYAIPAQHHTVGPDDLRAVKERYDEIWEQARWSAGGFPYPNQGRSALVDTPEQRRAVFEQLWAFGGLRFMVGNYIDVLFNREANRFVAEFVREKIGERVHDPRTRELLLPPAELPFGAKRPIVETHYFETYNRDDVELVDIRTHPIVEVTPAGIRTEGRHHELEVIVFATGFDAVTGPLLRLNITGRDGLRLADHWAHGPASHLGLAVHGFPNMFMITGPGCIFGNIAVIAEHHVEWTPG
jgi:cation diffusion facilitator CzcD-associated flavoprotein CzcO